jgi:hypothetical protein
MIVSHRWPLLLAATFVATNALAAEQMRFWNMTSVEIDELYLAPAGTEEWGPNQTLNDDDKSVEADERLKLAGVKPGHYDVKFVDKSGRTCIVRNVEVKDGGKYAFSLEDNELKDCKK